MSRLSVILIATLAATLVSSLAQAQTKAKKQIIPDTAVRHKMNTISGTIRELGPYIASEQEFTKDKNKKIIVKHLAALSDLFKNLKQHPVIATQGLSLNQSIMTEQLMQTVNLFKTDKRSLARAKFTAALNLCVSCHTQSPGQSLEKLFHDKDIDKMKISGFEKAELYFITRDYEKAIGLYNQFLLKSKKTDDDELIYKALQRELIYYVRIRRNFAEGKASFDKLLKANVFNEKIAAEVREWAKTLGGKTLWDNFDPANVKEEEMEKFMKTFINDEEEGPIFTVTDSSEVYDLNLSTILMDYYNAHPQTRLGARILYWMAILDKRINDDLFFSVGDFYLLSCMEKYSKDPMAAACYEAYEEDLEINYISKDKKEFPPAIIEKLNSLKKLINYQDAP
jgi:cytochrome c553